MNSKIIRQLLDLGFEYGWYISQDDLDYVEAICDGWSISSCHEYNLIVVITPSGILSIACDELVQPQEYWDNAIAIIKTESAHATANQMKLF